jgi:hypothetical protein
LERNWSWQFRNGNGLKIRPNPRLPARRQIRMTDCPENSEKRPAEKNPWNPVFFGEFHLFVPISKMSILNLYNPWLQFQILPANRAQEIPMNLNHRGVEYVVVPSGTPGVWQWQFRIGDQVKTGKTETRISLLAMRRVRLRIDRELKSAARDEAPSN